MKVTYILFLILVYSIPNAAYSQKELDIIENYVNDSCKNCTQADLNIYIMNLCKKSDSTLYSYLKRFDSKLINEKYLKLDVLKKIKKNYRDSYLDLVNSRRRTMRRFAIMNSQSTVNDYNRGLLYLYMNQNIMTILAFMEKNTFGDFYITPPIWDN